MKKINLQIVFILFLIIGWQYSYSQKGIYNVFKKNAIEIPKISSLDLPDTSKWVYNGVVLRDASAYCNQPHNIIHAEWDNSNQTYVLAKQSSQVFQLNTYDEVNNKPLIDFGQRGGDYMMTKIIDIRNLKNPYLTFLYQRAGKINNTHRTGWSDTCFTGPEHRVVLLAVKNGEVRKPDQLLVEFISADSANKNKLINPLESDWNVHPRHGGLEPVTANPALSIFGGGGYRTGFFEKDKDSSLTFDDGIRCDLYDKGNDEWFKRVVVSIPDTFVKRGFVRIRFRVDAERNGMQNVMNDDNDDFYIDNIKLMDSDKPDIALTYVNIMNPYSMLNINTKLSLPVETGVSKMKLQKSDSFSIKIKIKHSDEPKWPGTPDEKNYTGTEPYGIIATFPGDTSDFLRVTDFDLNKFRKYLKKGINTFQMWAVVNSLTGNNDFSNDTIYNEFNLNLGNVIAYDPTDSAINDLPEFSHIPGCGLRTYGASSGDDYFQDGYLNAVKGSGQIGIHFDINETDTVYGYQAYFGSLIQSQDGISLFIGKYWQ